MKLTKDKVAKAVVKAGTFIGASKLLKVNVSTLKSFVYSYCPEVRPNPKRSMNRQIKELKPLASGNMGAPQREQLKGTRFIFTSAQNNTHINKKFWASLQTFCKHKCAKLYVSRFTYNKSGFQNATKGNDELWYDANIAGFELDSSRQVFEGLVFSGELDVLPTAEDPLSGLDSYAGYNSNIIPHAKVAMKSLPRLKGELPRFLYTTGTVTQRNYIPRKAGQKAEFHHVYGALYVEVDKDGYWFARQLIADSKGEFYDLDTRYTPTSTSKSRIEAITYGDIHIEKEDKKVSYASWGIASTSILSVLRPNYQFIHDLTDFRARNHHEINNPYFIARRYNKGEDSVEEDLLKSTTFLKKIMRKGSKVVVVESNHHEAFERWLRNAEGHRDPVNAEFFHTANARIFRAIRTNEKDFDVYEWALKLYGDLEDVKFLKTDESFTICGCGTADNGIEAGIHGHLGPNGTRGQSRAYRSLGRRTNVGHSHSASILDGVYTAGVSGKLDMDYNRGPSSWSNSHIITYPNGKRAIITIKNGSWRL